MGRVLIQSTDAEVLTALKEGLAPLEGVVAISNDECSQLVNSGLQMGRPFVGVVTSNLNLVRSVSRIDPKIGIVILVKNSDSLSSELKNLLSDGLMRSWTLLNEPVTLEMARNAGKNLSEFWERTRRVERLSSSVGHELGNLWQPIITGLEYSISQQKHPILLSAMDAAYLGVQISRDLMESFMPGKEVGDPEGAKIENCLGRAVRILGHHLRNKDLTLTMRSEKALRASIKEYHLVQIAINLILNAIEASPEGAKIQIDARRISDRTIEIEVKDFGRGIPPEYQAQIFEVGHSSKSRGSGFGLSLCRELIESAGGYIYCVSDPSSGTQLLVRLPEAVALGRDIKSVA